MHDRLQWNICAGFPGQANLPTLSDLINWNATNGTLLPISNIQGDILYARHDTASATADDTLQRWHEKAEGDVLLFQDFKRHFLQDEIQRQRPFAHHVNRHAAQCPCQAAARIRQRRVLPVRPVRSWRDGQPRRRPVLRGPVRRCHEPRR